MNEGAAFAALRVWLPLASSVPAPRRPHRHPASRRRPPFASTRSGHRAVPVAPAAASDTRREVVPGEGAGRFRLVDRDDWRVIRSPHRLPQDHPFSDAPIADERTPHPHVTHIGWPVPMDGAPPAVVGCDVGAFGRSDGWRVSPQASAGLSRPVQGSTDRRKVRQMTGRTRRLRVPRHRQHRVPATARAAWAKGGGPGRFRDRGLRSDQLLRTSTAGETIRVFSG